MFISNAMDSGNIEVLECSNPENIHLNIRQDHNTQKHQWFHFGLHNAAGKHCQLFFDNAATAAYPSGWENYRAVASYDRDTWFRVDTHYLDSKLVIDHFVEEDLIYFAYFAPYSTERHRDLIAACQTDENVQYHALGQTVDGQTMDMLQIGEASAEKKICWLIARQHPGETMAEWWMEGALSTLLDDSNAIGQALLQQCVFYIVPNMNPDGSRRGHLRHNANGVDLNRAWRNANLDDSPEVYLVRQKMEQTGVDFFLDVHGDEGLPYNFIAGAEGIPSWSPSRQAQLDGFKSAFKNATPEFQTQFGYPFEQPGQANLDVGSNFVAQHFECLSMTLEMPFKDNADLPNQQYGWSPERSSALASPCLLALLRTIEHKLL